MQNSKNIVELEKREQKSRDVNVKLFSTSMNGFYFNVYKDDEKLKYIGEISQDHLHDECGCQSFLIGNSENYKRENPLPFQCKHILGSHLIMDGFW